MSKPSQRIAVLTSGGDAPGMNAAIRAIVMTAENFNCEVIGFYHGYNGLIENEAKLLTSDDVRAIIGHGGTILKSARCQAFKSEAGAKQAAANLNEHNIDSLIIIGGDGSFNGALHLANFWQGNILALPGTIDNDIEHTDNTIGFATAVDTAIEAVDKIRDTADAFERIFLVEVMGRHSGYIAMDVAIATAAEQLLTFENNTPQQQQLTELIKQINNAKRQRGDESYIIIIAENYWPEGSAALAQKLSQLANIDCQPCILGHIQRGGRPVSKDRILATKLGVAAVISALNHESLIMLGEQNNKVVRIPLDKVCNGQASKSLDRYLFNAQRQIFETAKH
jgi:6-phosphofructokinase 1